MTEESLPEAALREAGPALSAEERAEGLRLLPRDTAEDLLFSLSAPEQAGVIESLPAAEQRSWMRALAPDDAAALLQEIPVIEEREGLLGLPGEQTPKDGRALMAYRERHPG